MRVLRLLFAPVAALALFGSSALSASPALAATSPNLVNMTPAELVSQFSDHQPVPVQLSGHGDGQFSRTVQLPNAQEVATALANPKLNAQQRAALESIPTEVKLSTAATGTAGSDPVADAYMDEYDIYGNHIWHFEVNLGWNESNGVVTGVSTPNYVGTWTSSTWSETGLPQTSYPFDPIGTTEFDTTNTTQFTGPGFPVDTVQNVTLDVAYQAATGDWTDNGYVNNSLTWEGSGNGQ